MENWTVDQWTDAVGVVLVPIVVAAATLMAAFIAQRFKAAGDRRARREELVQTATTDLLRLAEAVLKRSRGEAYDAHELLLGPFRAGWIFRGGISRKDKSVGFWFQMMAGALASELPPGATPEETYDHVLFVLHRTSVGLNSWRSSSEPRVWFEAEAARLENVMKRPGFGPPTADAPLWPANPTVGPRWIWPVKWLAWRYLVVLERRSRARAGGEHEMTANDGM